MVLSGLLKYMKHGDKMEYSTIKVPNYTWRVWLWGSTYIVVEDTKIPNRFYRFMQFLILGFRWEKM